MISNTPNDSPKYLLHSTHSPNHPHRLPINHIFHSYTSHTWTHSCTPPPAQDNHEHPSSTASGCDSSNHQLYQTTKHEQEDNFHSPHASTPYTSPPPSSPSRQTLTLNENNNHPLPISNTLFISIPSHSTFNHPTRNTRTLTTNKLTTSLQYVTLFTSIHSHSSTSTFDSVIANITPILWNHSIHSISSLYCSIHSNTIKQGRVIVLLIGTEEEAKWKGIHLVLLLW